MSCREVYENSFKSLKASIADTEWNEVLDFVDYVEDILRKEGIDIEDAIPLLSKPENATQATQILESLIMDNIDGEVKNIARTSSTVVREQSVLETMKSKIESSVDRNSNVSYTKQKMQVLNDTLFNPVEGGISLETLQKITIADVIENQLHRGLLDILDGNIKKLRNDVPFRNDVLDEFHNIMHQKGQTTNNTQARQTASLIHKVRNEQRVRLNRNGMGKSWQQTGLMPAFNWGKIKKDKNGFINTLSESMDDTHGTPDDKALLASEIYSNLEKNRGIVDWDSIGEELSIEGIEASPFLNFKDGEAYRSLGKYSDEKEWFGSVMRQLEHGARQEAVAKLFHNDRTFRKLVKWASENENGRVDSAVNTQSRRATARFDRITKTFIPEHIRLSKYLGIGRSLEVASKLGGTLFSAMVDIPISIHVLRTHTNTPLHKILGNMMRGTSSEIRQKARYTGALMEGSLNIINNRFSLGNDLTDNASVLASRASHTIMQASGLDGYTQIMKAGVVATMDTHFGDIIKSKTSWQDLGVQNPQLKNNLIRHDIGGEDWGRIIQTRNLDENGNFDLFQIADTSQDYKNGVTLRDKITSFYTNTTESGVLTPGMRESEIISGMLPGTIEADIRKTIGQFMSFGITAHRKILLREGIQDGRSVSAKAWDTGVLMAMSYAIAIMVSQSKEVMKGNNPYSFDDPELHSRAAQLLPLGTAGELLFRTGVIPELFELITGEETNNFQNDTEFLGPLFADLAKITIHGIGALQEDGDSARYGLAKDVISSTPGQNLWYLQALNRYIMMDYLQELIDPKGYRRTQRRLRTEADNRVDISTGRQAPDVRMNITRETQSTLGR